MFTGFDFGLSIGDLMQQVTMLLSDVVGDLLGASLALGIVSPIWLVLIAMTIAPWMVKRNRDSLDLRVISVRGRRANQARWLDEEGFSRRLWYVGRATAGWVASALGNPFSIMPKGWSRVRTEMFRYILRDRTKLLAKGEQLDMASFLTFNKDIGEWNKARDDAIEQYRGWLREQVAVGSAGGKSQAFAELREIYHELKSGEKIVLGCWCAPDPCHGEVVADAVSYLDLAAMSDKDLQKRFGKKKLRTIITGSRHVDDVQEVKDAVVAAGWSIGEVISGASKGVDTLGLEWARDNHVGARLMPAKQKDGEQAESIRNDAMLKAGEALIVVWDGVSAETKRMINTAREKGLAVYVHRTDTN